MPKIYLINQYGTDRYKIGTTLHNVSKRGKQLQTGNPDELVVVKTFETKHPFKLEKLLHLMFFKTVCIGEWFELNDNDVFGFIDVCAKLERSLEFLSDHNPFF